VSPGNPVVPLVAAAVFVAVAAALACAEVGLSRVSRVRVEELARADRRGAPRLQQVLADPPRSLNLLLLLRLVCELSAAGIVTAYCLDRVDGSLAVVLAVLVMTLISYIVIGVAPRTIGRQQAERVALLSAGPTLSLARLFARARSPPRPSCATSSRWPRNAGSSSSPSAT